MRIIGIAGRKESGKTMLSEVCAKNGYHIVYFATPLKKLTADLIGVRYDDIDRLKTVESTYTISESDIDFLSSETGIPKWHLDEKIKGKTFRTVREILQYLGTDVIRKYDNDWHVKKTKEYILECGFDKICVGDVRFPNEKLMIEEMGGNVWFITRPSLTNVSNHSSETSIRWNDCKDVIVNNGEKKGLISRWEAFIEDYDKKLAEKREIETNGGSGKKMMELFVTTEYEKSFNWSVFNNLIVEIVEQDDFTVTVKFSNGKIYDITNPLEREELKLYLPCLQ